MSTKHLVVGLLTGAISGAVYGLLTTKHSGAENRAHFKSYARTVKKDWEVVSQDLSQLKSTIQTIQEDALPKAQIFQNEVNHAVSRLQKEAEPRQRRIEKRLENIQQAADQLQ